ncbi:protein disulfide oxidoreductase [Glaesserella parasuis]|uniref:protein disulfide oxidoreductase n=1 Tax=Glaesserella parasuis TaxID=738 RepID=UPI0024367A21|nr:protein disulfide oxidoreductase [Glaesserella parasuis]MDG6253762.1 protein disulfide oxidoreductase [Glaesserella parasuis]MDG6470357.1 protein disulfide oxidoreductase [Glaesserella parasuis]
MKKHGIINCSMKNILLFVSLFVLINTAADWFRRPNPSHQFAEQVLYDLEKNPQIIAQLSHRKSLLLYFWGSWCKFCEYTSPSISQLVLDGANVLSIALKSGSDDEVKQYMKTHQYHFVTINDPIGTFSKSWDIQATPTLIIVKDGKMISHTTGFSTYWGIKIRLWLADWVR